MPLVSIITPAFQSQAFVHRAVNSVLAQTLTNWEMIIISDDGQNYESVLRTQGITDPRLRFTSTGGVAIGASHARNVGLAAAQADIIALLDSDDFFLPTKLETMVPLATEYGFCACAIRYVTFDEQGVERDLRHYNPAYHQGLLKAEAYPFVNYSGNTMTVFDRSRILHRWDETLLMMEDLVFAMKAYNYIDAVYHIAEPLHGYVRREGSLCNSDSAVAQFVTAKKRILELIDNDTIGIQHESARRTLRAFISISVESEEEFSSLLQRNPNAIFSEFLLGKMKAAGMMAVLDNG